MKTVIHIGCLGAFVVGAMLAGGQRAAAQEKDDPAVQKRVWELIAIFADPEARGKKLKEAVAAQEELTRIGAPAAKQLVAALLEEPASSNIGFTSAGD
jgi:hypothetical protein